MQTREPELSPPATPPDGVELPDSGATNGDATRKGPRKRVIGIVVGGIGVVAANPAVAEFAAFTAATSSPFAIVPAPPGVVIIGGVALPFVNQVAAPEAAGAADGSYVIGPSDSPVAAPEGDLIADGIDRG